MNKAGWFVISLVASYFYVHGIVWVANNTPIYVSIPVIWITLSIWACVGWWKFMSITRKREWIKDQYDYYV